MSDLEIIAVPLNILGVWLTARRIRWCWPVSVLAVLPYAWIFYQAKLYSDTLLQGIFALLQGYGWWRWSQGGTQVRGQLVAVDRPPHYQRIREQIANDIATGTPRADEKFPSEREMIERFGCTRVTLRQALQQLEAEGLVYRENRRGWFVSPQWSSTRNSGAPMRCQS
jgi:biotin operon repressor